MKILAILAALFLSIGYGHAQTYEKFVEKSFDFLDKNDLVSAEAAIRIMRPYWKIVPAYIRKWVRSKKRRTITMPC